MINPPVNLAKVLQILTIKVKLDSIYRLLSYKIGRNLLLVEQETCF